MRRRKLRLLLEMDSMIFTQLLYLVFLGKRPIPPNGKLVLQRRKRPVLVRGYRMQRLNQLCGP